MKKTLVSLLLVSALISLPFAAMASNNLPDWAPAEAVKPKPDGCPVGYNKTTYHQGLISIELCMPAGNDDGMTPPPDNGQTPPPPPGQNDNSPTPPDQNPSSGGNNPPALGSPPQAPNNPQGQSQPPSNEKSRALNEKPEGSGTLLSQRASQKL